MLKIVFLMIATTVISARLLDQVMPFGGGECSIKLNDRVCQITVKGVQQVHLMCLDP